MLLTLLEDQGEQPWPLHSRTLSVGQTNGVDNDALLPFPENEEREDEEEGSRMTDQS